MRDPDAKRPYRRAVSESAPAIPARRPWHAPQFMLSNLKDTEAGGLSTSDLPAVQQS